jgi:acyl-coenzyme A synthetase/AMP-(fatty) acid ligase
MAVADRIFAHARATPDRPAVVYNGRAFSYRVFAALIGLARRWLAGQAIDRDRVAVVCVANLLDAWIVGLALRSLGVTTVNARTVEDVARLGLGAVSIVATVAEAGVWTGLAEAAAAVEGRLIVLPADVYAGADTAEIEDAARLAATAPGGQILLTSGTTGVFKKVLIDVATELRDVPLRAESVGLTAGSRFNLFDFGLWTTWGHNLPVCAWSLGATIVIHQGPERWRSLLDPGLTHAGATAYMLEDLLAAPPQIPLRNDAMALFVGAGVIPQALWRAARERLTGDVRNIYGSTEGAVALVTPLRTVEDLQWHQPNPRCRVEVVDEHDRPLPVGQTGRVRIHPARVDGYLNDPQTSREVFRDGFFYPGDLGVLREDGRLSLQGRITDVINVQGGKFATTPIETALQEALDAEAVCVFSALGLDGEAVHVALQLRRTVSPAELKAALLAALPPGVADVQVHAVDGFPRNHMGKIERARLKALLAPEPAAPRPPA